MVHKIGILIATALALSLLALAVVLNPQVLPEKIYKRFQALTDQQQGAAALGTDAADRNVGSRFAIWLSTRI